MKYIVMECHEGYAVLMDEEARFVDAANMHYKVGQTVTDPILMNDKMDSHRNISMIVGRVAAAAACIALLSGGGYSYYSRNLKVDSTILISSKANITISMNKKGNVIQISYKGKEGEEIVKNYNAKGKDKLTVTNELIEIEKSKGYLSKGDTVDLYISTEKSEDYDTYKSQIENGISEADVKVNVIDAAKIEPEPHNQPVIPKPAENSPANAEAAKPNAVPAPDKPADPPRAELAQQSGEEPAPPVPQEGNHKDNVPPTPADVRPDAPEPPQHRADSAEAPVKPDNNAQPPAVDKPEIKDPENVKPADPDENAVPRPAPAQTPEPDDKASPEIVLVPKPGAIIADKLAPEDKKELSRHIAPEPEQEQDTDKLPVLPPETPAENEAGPHHSDPAPPHNEADPIHSDAIKPIE